MPIKSCKGKIYIIDGKEWCVGEKTSSKKYGNSKKSKSKKTSKSKK